jgi:hypothetical protein
MIRDTNSSKMEEPNANEQEWAMGFRTNISTVWGISEVLIDEYWNKLWILHVSHGSLTYVVLNMSDLHSLSRPPTRPLLLLHLHLG